MSAEDWARRFAALATRRTERSRAPLPPVRTLADAGASFHLRAIGDAWSNAAFGGPFFETRAAQGALTTGLVFVQSREGNTATRDPAAFGAGPIDEHLIYEGLSRVAADAVIAGAGTLHPDAFFTVWRPELVELRARLNLSRHPAQVVMSREGSVRVDELLMFNLPEVPVYVLTTPRGGARLSAALAERPWVTATTGASLQEQFAALAAAGIRRACSVGGRRSATDLVDAGLVQDVYLTTAPASGGEPDTPWYTGKRAPRMRTVLVKEWDGEHGVVRFEHGVL